MIRQSRRDQGLAVCLSALAGFVDSIGFLYLGGFFVSFMSGNSTRLAVGLGTDLLRAALPLELIGAFVLGVILGSLGGRLAGGRRRTLILAMVSALLCMAGGVGLSGTQIVPALLASAAMGAVNTLFEAEGDVSVGLTYMTGTLVKFGLRLSAALTGGDRFGWAPYLVLWLGMLAGAVAGAVAYGPLGAQGFWVAGAGAALLAAASFFGRFGAGLRDRRGP
jgi:uncharacterized membrane protein YoaK (UPF0700 family)